jgi:hypothetical protein
MKPLRLVVLCLALLLSLPVSAQTVEWCRSFDFSQGQQGWALSYSGSYGRYNQGMGWSVTNYGSTNSYEHSGSIRIHRDFSGTVSHLFIFAKYPDYSHVFMDWNSSVSDAEPLDDDVFTSGGASPAGITFNARTVSGRLGLEFVKTNAPLPMQTVIVGIILAGQGTNPFGANNCATSSGAGSGSDDAAGGFFDTSFSAPFDEMFGSLNTASETIGSLPNDITAPNGSPLLPSADGRQVFGYAKWLLSPSAADEYAGPFAPLFQHAGIAVGLMMALIAIYIGVYVMIYVVRFVIWLAGWVFKLVDLLLQFIQVAGSVIVEGGTLLIRAVRSVFG